jgi:acetyl-CoA carboxylase, biotin carboxylase subunit
MKRALDELRIEGIKTTAPFHKRVLSHATFAEGLVDTKFVERELLAETA